VLGGHDASLKDIQIGTRSPADSAAADSDTTSVSAAAQAPVAATAMELSMAKLHHVESTDNAHPPPDHASASVISELADDMPKRNSSAIAVTASSATAAPSKPTMVSELKSIRADQLRDALQTYMNSHAISWHCKECFSV